MRKELLFLIIVVIVVVALSWHFGRREGRLEFSQEAANLKLVNLESRLQPLEDDFRRRSTIRKRTSGILRWVIEKVNFWS